MTVLRFFGSSLMLFCLVCCVQVTADGSRAASLSSVLPRGAHIEVQQKVTGYSDVLVLRYRRAGSEVLALVAKGSSGYALRWSRPVGGGTWTLGTPGPRGLFQGVSPRSAAGGQSAFAFLYDGHTVTSALQGNRSGLVEGDRGIAVKRGRLVVRQRDATHSGSVAYRYDTTYLWKDRSYVPGPPLHHPDYPKGAAPRPSVTLRAADGSLALIRVQIANTAAQRATGLMDVHSMDPDSGMIFVWDTPTLDAFWMHDTYIPLSIAWIDSSMKVIGITEMAALDETLHYAPRPYLYAIEANAGYFAANGIHVDDSVQLHLQP